MIANELTYPLFVELTFAVSNWTMAEAFAASASAVVLLVGGYLAQHYGHGADTSLTAESFVRPDGDIGLNVQVRVKCVGLRAVRITNNGSHLPKLIISEQLDDGHQFKKIDEHEFIAEDLMGQIAGPGESINWIQLVRLRPTPKETAGWLVEFRFSIRRQILFWKFWTWTESVFVPS
jgi:hypothetical protein